MGRKKGTDIWTLIAIAFIVAMCMPVMAANSVKKSKSAKLVLVGIVTFVGLIAWAVIYNWSQ